MKEDIKILEEYLKELQFTELKEIVLKKDICKIIEYEQLQAIENLIARNKELEEGDLRKDELVANFSTRHFHDREKIREQQEQLNIANKKILAQKGQLKVVNNSYIPKSKVRDKIEYILKNYSEHSEFSIGKLIEFLEELLQEGDK